MSLKSKFFDPNDPHKVISPFDPNKYKPRSKKQEESWSRNFAIMRLRGAYSLKHLSILQNDKNLLILNPSEIEQLENIFDHALSRLNAETEKERRERWKRERETKNVFSR